MSGEFEEVPAPVLNEAPKRGTIGELAAVMRRFDLVSLSCALTLLQGDEGVEPDIAAAYKACWQALKPHAEKQTAALQALVEAHGPPSIDSAVASLQSAAWKRVRWSGNPKHPTDSKVIYGWRVRLGRHTTMDERAWLHGHGFEFSGGWWGRPDEGWF